MNQKLLDQVIWQITRDILSGDTTAIEVLIADIPDKKAIHFLPEDNWEEFQQGEQNETTTQ